jgi:HD-GYP domain-containing protein (c-di-GMP phosphodiesterase class II)
MSHPTAYDGEGGPVPDGRVESPEQPALNEAHPSPSADVRRWQQSWKGPMSSADFEGSRSENGKSATVQHKVRLAVSELKIGMYVCELDRPWLDSPFGFQGFPLRSIEDIQAVKRVCAYVFVDAKKSVGVRTKSREASTATPVATENMYVSTPAPPRKRARRWFLGSLGRQATRHAAPVSTIHSLEVAHRAYDETSNLVRTLLEDIRWGRGVDTVATKEAVSACAEQVTRDPAVMVLLASIKDKDDYTAQHSLNVAILSMVLGHHLGLPKRTLIDVGVGGLLHDVGKTLIPMEILKKPGRLTPTEYGVVKMHPAHGKGILESTEGIGRVPVEVAYTHHERLDGSGYPRGLREAETGLVTRIVAITDTYDAVTSDRIYDDAKTSIEAFKILQAASGNHYDGQLVSELIGAIGVFPPGSMVQLNNGKFGVVVRANPSYEFRPTVLVLKDAKQRPVRPRYVDLADVSGGASSSFQIARLVQAGDCGIDSAIFRTQDVLEAAAG